MDGERGRERERVMGRAERGGEGRRKRGATRARTSCHEAIMELPAAMVATLLSILYHLIRERKIDTFRICGTKVPIRRDGKIELTSLQVI